MDEKGTKLGALSSLMASYGDDSEAEDEAVAAEQDEAVAAEQAEAAKVSARQLASEILEGLVATAFRGERSRPDAFTAAQEPSGSEEEGESDSDDSGNEVRTVNKSARWFQCCAKNLHGVI